MKKAIIIFTLVLCGVIVFLMDPFAEKAAVQTQEGTPSVVAE